MLDERTDFINALESYVLSELRQSAVPADYHNGSVQIADARNHLFRNAGVGGTDEELGIYALRDLCRVDEDTMELVPNRQRFAAIAKELGLDGNMQ